MIHAGDPTAAQAQGDLTTAYNDAAGRTVGAIAVAGNLGGLTLTPGLYKSTSSLEISSGDLTLDAQGDATAVFIFQMASTFITTVGRQVILSGGAKAANIYWQVGSSATLGAISVVKGNILALASITLQTGATLEGRALARTGAVSLDSNTVGLVIPADTTPPTVSSTDPVNAATGVAINRKIAAAFSESMDPSTITTTTFTLKQGTTAVAGTVTYAGVTATFTPSSNLAANTTYTASITTGATDLAGNPLASSYAWSFTTAVTADTTAPTVTLTVPANAATGVPINQNLSATFSEAMDPSTMTTATFTLTQGATPLAGAVTYAAVGTTVTFNPTDGLAPLTTFTATITTGARDLAGNPLLNNFAWSFTTGAAADTNRPTVIATVPANSATGVAINQTINATFSEAMDPATISTADFLVTGPGTTPVTGTVAYDVTSKIATFIPASNLSQNTVYRATMTTGSKDLAGNALASNFVWNFATAATTAGQAPIALGSATTFAVLAGSTVTSTGGSTVNGDLGVSPGTTLTGAPTVNGTTHLGDPAAAQAQLDLTTAYNDAAGRTVGAIGVAGNLGGQTLTPGLYKSTSSLEVSSGDLTLDAQGDANAVFIFQMASTLTTTASRQVILSGGAKAANIFWQVGSSATLGTGSVLKGNILALTSITLTTGATLEGRALAGNGAVTLDSNTVGLGIPADTTRPTVSSTDPANAATGVAINKKIAATFSESMDPSTISTTNFILKQGTTPVAGTVTYVGTTATFAPASALAINTTYAGMITTGVKDLAGNAMASAFGWSFTTGSGSDTTAPTVSFTDPASAATGVAVNKKIAATFSEAMDPLTISTASFTLQQGTTPVAGTVTYAGTTATFAPASGLAANTVYTATITTGARDLAGNPLLSNFAWSFTSGATVDTTRPTVSSTAPGNAATGVAVNQSISATFSEAMNPTTINTADFTVAGPGATPVTGTVAYDVNSKIATFTPSSNLAQGTLYTATITTGVQDLAGNALASNFAWSFTTTGSTSGQAPVALGSAATFGVLAGSTVTSTGGTTVNGDLGVNPGTTVTGFSTIDGGPGIVNGTIHLGDPAAAQAQLDLTTAYNDAAGRTVGAIGVAGNLGGQTLTPGLYKSTSSLEISSGDLTLDAQGDANAVFIFQMASTFTTTTGRQIILSGGASAANIYWQVGSSATLGTTSVFKGNILAYTSITVTTGAAVEGRLLARNGAVTLDSNTITRPTSATSSAIVQSAALVTGPFTDAAGQSLNLATKTITLLKSGSMGFYRLRSTTALTITSITISGGNVVITYN
jgi:tetrahydromethanopterin S-methyltransferase subunit B